MHLHLPRRFVRRGYVLVRPISPSLHHLVSRLVVNLLHPLSHKSRGCFVFIPATCPTQVQASDNEQDELWRSGPVF